MIKRIGEQYYFVIDGTKTLVATPSAGDKEKFDLYIDTRNTMRGVANDFFNYRPWLSSEQRKQIIEEFESKQWEAIADCCKARNNDSEGRIANLNAYTNSSVRHACLKAAEDIARSLESKQQPDDKYDNKGNLVDLIELKTSPPEDERLPDFNRKPEFLPIDDDELIVDGTIVDDEYATKDCLRRHVAEIAEANGISEAEALDRIQTYKLPNSPKHDDEWGPSIGLLIDCGLSLAETGKHCGGDQH